MRDDRPRPDDPDSPQARERVVRSLLIVAPCLFVFSALFARWQGAAWSHSVLIVAVALLMFFGAALAYALRGARSLDDAHWLAMILRLFTR